jgi:hypothetical protein
MISFEQVLYIAPILALTASILYYSINVRNANKTQKMQLETRQVQIFMNNIIGVRSSPEFQKLIYRVTFIDEWNDLQDYFNRYGPEHNLDAYSEHMFVWQLYDSVGFLLKKEVIDLSYIDDLFKASLIVAWKKFEPVIKMNRQRVNQPNLWNQFEYLAEEVMRTQQ